ncbi:DUF1707 domain-containing protein [Nocardia thailandica]|uniref:DUF1707 domain-containing protein n=1 Tax=Nocardia thailandica TaxID=257275 RepID=A0ABW6PFW9_9NOCA
MSDSGRESSLRARDIDRAQVSTVLDAAYAEGQLSPQEYHDRVERAGNARTLGELRGLTADLQSPVVFGGAAPESARTPLRRGRGDTYPARVRARDRDREATVHVLDEARAQGQLDADEHTALTQLAAEARTLGDLSTLVADLQYAPAPRPARPRSRRHVYLRTATAAAVVAAAVGGFVWTMREPARPVPAALTPGFGAVAPRVIPTPRPASLEGFVQFRADYLAKFGNGLVDEVYLHDTHASVKRMVNDRPDWSEEYTYRGGFERAGEQISTRKRETAVADLAAIDPGVLGRVLAGAPATVGVPDGVVSMIRLAEDSSFRDQVVLSVYVTNELKQSGRIELTPAGAVLQVYEYKGPR